jgi:hypothetical protein
MRDNQFTGALWGTFALAAVLNLIEAVADPDGGLWTGARIVVSVLFGLALFAWVIVAIRKSRGRVG